MPIIPYEVCVYLHSITPTFYAKTKFISTFDLEQLSVFISIRDQYIPMHVHCMSCIIHGARVVLIKIQI